MLSIDCTDPFFVIRFLRSVYTNYLNHVKLNNSGIVTGILDKSRAWKGGSAAEFKQHLGDIQAMMARLPPSLRSTCDQNLIINMIISNLKDDSNLDALHTVIRSKYNDCPASVTFAYIEREVTSILKDKYKSGGVVTETSREDPIASMATFYTQTKKRPFQPRGKFTANQTRSLISKASESKYRIPGAAWKVMSEEERREAIKVMRTFNNENRDSNNRGRGGRGRGGRAAQSQRRPEAKSEAEADIAEITSRSISCFNTEIAREIHDMPAIEDDDAESQEQFKPTVLFTAAEDSQQQADDQKSPKVEPSPIGSAMQPDWSIQYIFSALLPITLITGLLWGLLMGTSKILSECLKKCF
jgi:hypothetical protein